MSKSSEQYQPSQEELKEAEKMMSDKEKELSITREEDIKAIDKEILVKKLSKGDTSVLYEKSSFAPYEEQDGIAIPVWRLKYLPENIINGKEVQEAVQRGITQALKNSYESHYGNSFHSLDKVLDLKEKFRISEEYMLSKEVQKSAKEFIRDIIVNDSSEYEFYQNYKDRDKEKSVVLEKIREKILEAKEKLPISEKIFQEAIGKGIYSILAGKRTSELTERLPNKIRDLTSEEILQKSAKEAMITLIMGCSQFEYEKALRIRKKYFVPMSDEELEKTLQIALKYSDNPML